MIDVPKVTIDKLGMNIGYALSEETFADYARIKSVTIELFQYDDLQTLEPVPGQVTATFEDKPGFQMVDIDNMEIDESMNIYDLINKYARNLITTGDSRQRNVNYTHRAHQNKKSQKPRQINMAIPIVR